ncbi:hypothetical protein O181_007386 [Austropuccinia psidii MF-1]|uniref:Uncharacterized protein n=1 Tax=Austropuccinia psidii MF-1 TaxID=1389203 RepID=A0A9Q3BKQ3_9BASI|nr:hypothetical protein [Austropuccinia psidii MF-1]
MLASKIKRYLWSKKDGPFGKEFPVSEAPTPDGTSGYSSFGGRPTYSISEVPISRINTEGVVKQIRQIAHSPSDPDAECSDELDSEEIEVVLNSSGYHSSTSPSQPAAKIFKSQLVPSTPRNLQPVLSTIPPRSPSPSTARPVLVPTMRTSPIPPWSPPNSSNLWPAPVEEEKTNCLFGFLQPKCFSKGNVGLSGLPERIQRCKMKVKILWPGYLEELIEIVRR